LAKIFQFPPTNHLKLLLSFKYSDDSENRNIESEIVMAENGLKIGMIPSK
jgi:hypothetical protein